MSEVAVVGKVEYATGQHVPKQDAFAIAAVVPIIHQEEDCPEQTNIGGGCSYEGCKHVQDISGMSGGTFSGGQRQKVSSCLERTIISFAPQSYNIILL